MKARIIREPLAQVIKEVGGIAVSKDAPLFGILGNLLVEAGDGLIFTASNLEIAVRQRAGARVDREGVYCLPLDVLSHLVAAFPRDGLIEIDVDDRLNATIQCENQSARIKARAADDFPFLPQFEEYTAAIPAGDLRRLIAFTAIAAAKADNRPVLTGIRFDLTADGLTFVAADGYRLAVATTDTVTGDIQCTIPATAMLTLARSLTDEVTEVEVGYAPLQGRVYFRHSSYEMAAATLEGSFPDYRSIIPARYETTVTAYRDDLQRALKLQQLFAADSANAVRLSVDRDRIEITSRSQDRGEASSSIDAAVIRGPSVTASFDQRFLRDAFAAAGEEQVTLHFTSTNAPMMLTPQDSAAFKHLIMPMSLNRPSDTPAPETAPVPEESPEPTEA